jgi:hypothetical protein
MVKQKIEDIFLYVCSILWGLLGILLTTLYLVASVKINVTQPVYQILCYLMTGLMLPQVKIPFILRVAGFGFAIEILAHGLKQNT